MAINLLSPELLGCRRIFLRDFEVSANIGIHDAERSGAQRILVNVDLFVPLEQSTPRQDKIHEVLDYDFIRVVVLERIARGHINLQETLCDDVAAALVAHPMVRAARVSTQKPDIYPDCAGVGVEVFRLRAR
jgi:7,8-dihydroneopterin aldolase/epimerase/oxygenase